MAFKPNYRQQRSDRDRSTRSKQDEKLQKELGERGRTYAKTWSSASMARRLADLYDTIRLAPKAFRVVA